MKIGYARVSTKDQNLAMQISELQAAGCERIFTEKASGTKKDRPELERCLADLRGGDVLVVWKLDRLGRSLSHLISIIDGLHARNVDFKDVGGVIDTTSAGGKLLFQILGAFAEYERETIRERTMAGLETARANGHFGGRPPALSPAQRRQVHRMYEENLPVVQIADVLKTSRATIYRIIQSTPPDSVS